MQSIHNQQPEVTAVYSLFAIYQRYEMQSIHNRQKSKTPTSHTVCDISKIRNVVNSQRHHGTDLCCSNCLRYIKDTKCSQFTTGCSCNKPIPALFAIYQRYEMQSIHNRRLLIASNAFTVCDISKIRNVVNSQPEQVVCRARFKLFAIYQRYEMQSIHNSLTEWRRHGSTVCDISKIRNVVNSQLRDEIDGTGDHCLRYIKDTKCSQFTTKTQGRRRGYILFAIYQRYEMQSIHNPYA